MRTLFVLLSAPAVLVAIGCSSSDEWTAKRPPVYPAGGTVLYQGEPVEGALVVYYSADGAHAAQGRTDAEGNYTLTTFDDGDGAVEGTHKVVVRKLEYVTKRTRYDSPDEPSTAKIAHDVLPKKYSAPLTTDLSAEVASDGENLAQLTLFE